ncbi:MAG: bifunctional nuclease family protein [Bacillota bacterium]
MIRLFVKGIAYDTNSNPIVLLTDEAEENVLPIWIGVLEAHAIAVVIEGVPIQRPMTFDLINSLFDNLDVKVKNIVINDLIDNTYYAELHITTPKGDMIIDSRPSDAISIAMKSSAPVYLDKKLAGSMFKIKDLFDEEIQEELDKLFNSDAFKEHKKSLH